MRIGGFLVTLRRLFHDLQERPLNPRAPFLAHKPKNSHKMRDTGPYSHVHKWTHSSWDFEIVRTCNPKIMRPTFGKRLPCYTFIDKFRENDATSASCPHSFLWSFTNQKFKKKLHFFFFFGRTINARQHFVTPRGLNSLVFRVKAKLCFLPSCV